MGVWEEGRGCDDEKGGGVRERGELRAVKMVGGIGEEMRHKKRVCDCKGGRGERERYQEGNKLPLPPFAEENATTTIACRWKRSQPPLMLGEEKEKKRRDERVGERREEIGENGTYGRGRWRPAAAVESGRPTK
ncbi:hypothetical protein BHE74_00019872 [Ensete ventricosum]|uniref:Uncharacterized protein n=1 Tax=Ensete ventricosum TaxID=4639 RepID=A0A426YRV7_ENSVE|nr:hypothetical protein B296_00031577 [Ensete ventricosum]RWW72316.1 hypothetical protein BHE74_00019872 [Ensete ventricosum]